MELLLVTHELESYIYEDNVKMIHKSDSEYEEGCIPIMCTKDLYYAKGVTKKQIKNDAMTKRIISLNLDDSIKIKIDFRTKSAHQVWKLIESTYLESEEQRKINYRKELEVMSFNKNEDFELFLSNMINIFNKLKDLNDEVSDEAKYNYLYKSLPYDLIHATNIISYHDNWEGCCKHLNKIIPKLKFLKEYKNNQYNTNALFSSTEENKHKNINHNYINKRNNTYNINKNFKCYNCGGFGHIARNCSSKRHINNGKNYNKYKHNNKGKEYSYKNKKYNSRKGRTYANNAEETKYEENYKNIYDNVLNTDYNDNEHCESNSAIVEKKINNKKDF